MCLRKVKIQSFVFIFPIVFVINFCTDIKHQDPFTIALLSWELDGGNGFAPAQPVPWNSTISQGGFGKNYEGVGVYKTKEIIPDSVKDLSLAFYTPCVDDSCELILNGHSCGFNGMLPDRGFFRSGSRSPVLIPLNNQWIRYGDVNELSLRVYNYAGSGGFAYRQNPVIIEYSAGEVKKIRSILINDFPRTFVICIMIYFLIKILFKIACHIRKLDLRDITINMIYFIAYGFFPHRSFSRRTLSFKQMLLFRLVFAAVILFLLGSYLLSEVNWKYDIYANEYFWFKFPVFCIYTAVSLQLLMYRREVLFTGTFSAVRWQYRLLSIPYFLTHPMILFSFSVYLLAVDPKNAWNEGSFFGIFSAIVMTCIMLILSVVWIAQRRDEIIRKHGKIFYTEVIKREFAIRVILFLIIIASLTAVFIAPAWIFCYSLFVIIIAVTGYTMLALSFYSKYRIETSPVTDNSAKKSLLANTLRDIYSLTNTEILIAGFIFDGMGKKQKLSILGISNNTLKTHLKSIYAKTIDKNDTNKTLGEKKMHKLAVFLHNLSSA